MPVVVAPVQPQITDVSAVAQQANQLLSTIVSIHAYDPVTDEADIARLRTLLQRHAKLTNSRRAGLILDQWQEYLPRFIKVLPIEYDKVLQRSMEQEDRHSESPAATEEVYADEGR